MPLLEGRKTSTGDGVQLECRLCGARSAVYRERDECLENEHSYGWDVGSKGILCLVCKLQEGRRRTRYQVLSDA